MHRVHPWLFMVLIIPFGVAAGYVSVTLTYQLKMSGATVGQVTALYALYVLPHTWKFLWAPVVDVTLNQKKWYLIAGILTVIGISSLGFFPATKQGLAVLSTVVFMMSLATTVLCMGVESLMAHSTPDQLKGRASGWYQAGSLGGNGIGGGLALVLAERLHSPWLASCIIGGLCLICLLALVGVPTPARPPLASSLVNNVIGVAKDLWQVMRQRPGALALIICFLPICTGAIPFAAIASEWQASADTVALVTGVLSGVISAVGCILGGWMCDRMDRKAAYIWFGIFQAASGVAMALLPRTQTMFIVWGSVYNFSVGLTYAAFSAFVLEAIGKGAAATKYNTLASLTNMPIYYMTRIDGWAHDRWNSTGMFFTESGLALVAAVVFAALARILLHGRSTSMAKQFDAAD
jgi:MFS family permease